MNESLRGRIVEAGAGTGKTYNLVSEIIIALGHDPQSGKALGTSSPLRASQIFVLTFTEDAAAEMKERLLSRLSSLKLETLKREVMDELVIGTIHSLCYRLLSPHLYTLGFENGAVVDSVLTREAKQKHFIRRLADYETDSNALFESLKSKDLARLGADLWFNDFESQRHDILSRLGFFRSAFNDFIESRRSRCEWILANDPEVCSSKSWVNTFHETLTASDLRSRFEAAEKMSFVGGPQVVKKRYADLYEDARAFRDFCESCHHFLVEDDQLKREEQNLSAVLEFFKHSQIKRPKHLDFAAMEAELYKLIKTQPQLIQSSPRLIIVDEFQDTNPTQFEILKALAKEGTEFYLVGDPKQSIYAFRNADVRLFMGLKKELKTERLSISRRSDKDLLEFQNLFQSKLFSVASRFDPDEQNLEAWDELPKIRSPRSSQNAPVEIHFNLKKEALFKKLTEDLKTASSVDGNSTQGVLFEKWKDLYDFASYLELNKIKYRIAGSPHYLNHHLSALFCDYLESLTHEEALIGRIATARWASEAKQPHGTELSISLVEADFALQAPRAHSLLLSQCFADFCNTFDCSRWVGGVEWQAVMTRLVQNLPYDLILKQMDSRSFASFLKTNLLNFDAKSPPREKSESDGGITLCTIHGSKGLEYDKVYIPELSTRKRNTTSDGIGEEEDLALPLRFSNPLNGKAKNALYYEWKRREKQIADDAEKRRLFYVAVTRARRELKFYIDAPPKKSAPKPDPWRVLGFEPRNSKSLCQVLHELRAEASFQSLEVRGLVNCIDHESPLENSEAESELQKLESKVSWNLPAPLIKSSPPREFLRMGITEFLAREELTGDHSLPQPHAVVADLKAPANEIGTRLHAFLESWNGDLNDLNSIEDSDSSFISCLKALRSLPELQDYWRDLEVNPERIQREFGVFLYSDDYRLSGFADVVWFKSRDSLVLIDWKTSSRLSNLTRPERLEKFRDQLRLYAKAFESRYKNIEIMVLGISINEGICQLLLDQSFSSE